MKAFGFGTGKYSNRSYLVDWEQPILTSDFMDVDEGVISLKASSIWNRKLFPYLMLSGEISNISDEGYWQIDGSDEQQEVVITFPYKLAITGLKVTTRPYDNCTRNCEAYTKDGVKIGSTIYCNSPVTEYTFLDTQLENAIVTDTIKIVVLKDTVTTGSNSCFGLQNLKITAKKVVEQKFSAHRFFVKNGTARQYFKYALQNWSQPVMSSNGTYGGANFAVAVSSAQQYESNPYMAWHAYDNNTSTYWRCATQNGGWIGFYNPLPLRVTRINWGYYYTYPTSGNVQGSNDNSNWTTITNFTCNSRSDFNIDMSSNTGYYRYYRINVTGVSESEVGADRDAERRIHCRDIKITANTRNAYISNVNDYDFYIDHLSFKAITD